MARPAGAEDLAEGPTTDSLLSRFSLKAGDFVEGRFLVGATGKKYRWYRGVRRRCPRGVLVLRRVGAVVCAKRSCVHDTPVMLPVASPRNAKLCAACANTGGGAKQRPHGSPHPLGQVLDYNTVIDQKFEKCVYTVLYEDGELLFYEVSCLLLGGRPVCALHRRGALQLSSSAAAASLVSSSL